MDLESLFLSVGGPVGVRAGFWIGGGFADVGWGDGGRCFVEDGEGGRILGLCLLEDILIDAKFDLQFVQGYKV